MDNAEFLIKLIESNKRIKAYQCLDGTRMDFKRNKHGKIIDTMFSFVEQEDVPDNSRLFLTIDDDGVLRHKTLKV